MIYQATIVRLFSLVLDEHALMTIWSVELRQLRTISNLSQLRTILLKIDKKFFVRVHAREGCRMQDKKTKKHAWHTLRQVRM